jgi:hypothetical protein
MLLLLLGARLTSLELCDKMAALVVTQEVAKATPMVVDARLPPAGVCRKLAAPLVAQRPTES